MNLPKPAFPMRANAAVREPRLASRLTSETYKAQAKRGAAADAPTWVLHDGPPYANGSLHMGHLMNKVLKDIFNRHQALRGKAVRYVPGACGN